MPPRRHLCVVSSPEEDDYISPEQHAFYQFDDGGTSNSASINIQNISLNSSNTPHSVPQQQSRPPVSPIPLDISSSDEDGGAPNPNGDGPNNVLEQEVPISDGTVSGILRKLGLNLRREWLDSCMAGLSDSIRGFSNLDDSRKAKLCFEQFLSADMNYCGSGVLPENVHALHLIELKGPFVLQVDEIVNISCPLRSRYQKAAPGFKRCLKLSMTDGVQRIFGMEYRPISGLDALAPAGLKVAICNVYVRHGLLMLVPEAFENLGGRVDGLEAARQRLVQEVNKPPRGKRTRTGAVPLATRATLAAWPPGNVHDPVVTNNSSTESSANFHMNEQGTASGVPASGRTREHTGVPSYQYSETDPVSASTVDGGSAMYAPTDMTREDITPTTRRESMETNHSAVAMDVEEVTDRIREDIIPSTCRESMETNQSAVPMNVEEHDMADRLELPYILSGKKEVPFTYLASLAAKWAVMKGKVPNIQGTIKCFLTGVKGFQYKQREKYELRVFIDDGSLISEILVDHNLVKKGIGHSPQEVTAALASPDRSLVSEMKEKLKQFQLFLVNFEGLMVIKMNEECPFPVATEMNQGCGASDAWLLLQRLKSLGQTHHHGQSHPIELSP